MKDPKIIDRADRVVNLLRVDELYSALEEFRDEDFRAGFEFAANVCRPFSEGPAVDQADGGWGPRQSDALPELHGRIGESAERQQWNEKEMEEGIRLALKNCACTMEWDPKEQIYNLSICPYHKDTPNLFDSLFDV